MNAIVIIGCVVGVITCVVGVATFTSAQLSKASQDGRLLEKVEQACKGIDEIKKEMKEKNKEFDETLRKHSIEIAELKQSIQMLNGTTDK